MLYVQKRSYCIVCLLLCTVLNGFAQQVMFKADFAPTAPAVSAPEAVFRDAVSLNGFWQFKPADQSGGLSKIQITNPEYPDANNWEGTPVKVPSPWNVNNFATERIAGGDFVAYPSYPKKWEEVRAGWLKRNLSYRKEWKNKRLVLHFDGVGGFTQVYLNKKKIAENFDVFLPFEVDITGMLKEGDDNELSLWIADGQLLNEPGNLGRRVFVAGSFWGQHIRGIWQDVNLLVKPGIYVADTFIQPMVDRDSLSVSVTIKNTTGIARKIDLTGDIFPWVNLAGKNPEAAPEVKWELGSKVMDLQLKNGSVAANSQQTFTLKIKVAGRLKLWSPDAPNLYGMVITPTEKGKAVDKKYIRFGWRQFAIAGTKLNLNGKPIILKGDSWHFMGIPQMTRRYAWAWYTALKDANANAVRLHAQPYPAFYLDMADEMGICVLDETGMWASDGGPKVDGEEYWKRSEDHLKRFILRDRNHPAVFGWSVCNENLAVTIGVLHAPEPVVKRQLAEINKWVAITRQLDPTRTWISGDGETNEPTDLPSVVGHYGDANAYKDWSSTGKPWGIGEAGMAYYGTPKQTAEFNGNRSYQSQQGRLEGVAHEAIRLLNQQKSYHASYNSIFNLAWYGLQPLELGLADTTRKPTLADGIFFGPYQEGKDGVQPERLGPYTTTLNPGYDAKLPLYRTWPLFDAVKTAFADTSATAEPTYQPATINSAAVEKNASLQLLSADPDSALFHVFTELGLSVNKPVKNAEGVLVIDGMYPPVGDAALKQKNQVLKNGGTVLVWGISEQTNAQVNAFLPQPLNLTQRKSTSFLTQGKDVILGNLGDADFYFTENSDKPVALNGLAGPFADHGKTLLAASNTDWGVWNKQAEYLKTGAVTRSEREAKAGGNALVYAPSEKGGIYVLALDPGLLYKASPKMIKSILTNLGVSSQKGSATERNILASNGALNRILFIDPFDVSRRQEDAPAKNYLAGATSANFTPGSQIGGHTWKLITANNEYMLNPVNNPAQKKAIGYYSFWIYSPRSLSNLLLEPDMPKINLHVKTSNDTEVSLNKQILKSLDAIALEKGWNHITIRSVKNTGDWKINVSLSSDKKDFLNKEIKAEAYR